MKLRLPLLLAAALLCSYSYISTSCAAPGDSFSINFAADKKEISDTSTESFGGIAVEAQYWNDAYTSAGPTDPYVSSTGTDTFNKSLAERAGKVIDNSGNVLNSVVVQWKSAGGPTYNANGTPTNELENMMKGYLDDRVSDQKGPSIRVSDIPYLVSNLYIITSGDSSSAATQAAAVVNGTSYTYKDGSTQVGSEAWGTRPGNVVGISLVEGTNYLKISGIAGSNISIDRSTANSSRLTISGIQVEDAYEGTYLYRTVGNATENWDGSLWSLTSGGTADQSWNNDSHAAVITADADGSTLDLTSGITADGIILMSGTLNLDNGSLTLTGPSVLTIMTGATLNLNSTLNSASVVSLGGGGTLALATDQTLVNGITGSTAIDLGANTLTLGSTGSRLSSFAYDGAITGSSLKIYTQVTNGGVGGNSIIKLANAEGLSDLYVDGSYALNLGNQGQSNVIGSSTRLHLSAGGSFVVRSGINNGSLTNVNFSNDILLAGNMSFQLGQLPKVHLSSNISRETGVNNVNITMGVSAEGSNHLYLSGVIDVGTNGVVGTTTNSTGTFEVSKGITVSLLNQLRATTLSLAKGTINLEDGADVEVTRLHLAAEGSVNSTFNIKEGAKLTVNGSTTTGADDSISFLLGRWSKSGTVLNMSGGTVTAANASLRMIINGRAEVVMTGGEMDIKGINFLRGTSTNADSLQADFYLGAKEDGAGTGVLTLGSNGITDLKVQHSGQTTLTPNLYLGQGTISASDNWSTNNDGDVNIHLVGTQGTVFDPNGHTITINHDFDGTDGRIIVDGATAGTLQLNGTTGAFAGTTVNKGTLNLAASASAGRTLSMNRGTNLGGTSGSYVHTVGAGQTLHLFGTAGTVTINGGLAMQANGTLTLDTGSLAGGANNTTPYLTVTGDISFTGQSLFSLTGDNATLALGDYLLAEAAIISGFSNSFTSFYEIPEIATNYSYTISQRNNQLWMTIANAGEALIWNGVENNNWDTSTQNWTGASSSTAAVYEDGRIIIFDDTGTTGSINLTDQFVPAAITFSGPLDYVLTGSGSLAGAAKITKDGTGSVTLATDNSSYTGTIELVKGTLTAGVANALGSGNIMFSGGVLGLTTDTTLSSVSGDSDAKLLVESGTVVLTTGASAAPFYTKNITLTGAGNLTMTASSFGGKVTNAGTGALLVNFGTNLDITNSFEGELTVAGATDASTVTFTTAASFNGSVGHLIVDKGIVRFVERNDSTTPTLYTGDVDITLRDGAGLSLHTRGMDITSHNTLTMGAGSHLTLYNGNYHTNTTGIAEFGMNIVLTGGAGAASEIRGFEGGNNTTITGSITGTGNLSILRTSSYSNDMNFKTGWLGNSYSGNTLMQARLIVYNGDGMPLLSGDAQLTPWGTGDVTIGGDTRTDYQTLVRFSSINTALTSYTIANDITLTAKNNNSELELFTDSSVGGVLTGLLTVNELTPDPGQADGAISLRGGHNSLELAGGMASAADATLNVSMNADGAASNLKLTGNNQDFLGTLAVTSTKNVTLNSSAAGGKTFGGSITTGGANLTVAGNGQTIAGNLDVGSGTLVFNAAAISVSAPSLTIGGSLTIGTDLAITIDNTGGALTEDGIYTLVADSGTITGNYDLTTINWINQPASGTFTLSYTGNQLLLQISGLSALEWHGGSDGNGTWSVGGSGWGDTGADTFANSKAVLFKDLAGISASTVTITGSVAPMSVTANLANTTITLTGTGKITGATNLVKQGTGELIVATTNDFTGGTAVKAGTLTVKAVDALSTGDIALDGGALKLDGSGALINSASTLQFNGGELVYAGTAGGQDVSAQLGTTNSGTVKVKVENAANNVAWATNLNAIGLDVTKTGAGTLTLAMGATSANVLTVNEGMASIAVADTVSVDASKLAGTGSITLDSAGSASITGISAFTGSLTLKGSFDVGTMSGLNSVSGLALDNAVLTSTEATASFTKGITISTGAELAGASTTYTLSGALAGDSLNVSAQKAIFTGDLTGYASAITNTGGVQFGNSGDAATLGNGAFIGSTSLLGTGSYAVNYANATSLAAVVGGSAGLNQNGAGVLTLVAANTSTGTLNIDTGKIVRLGDGATDGSWSGTITGAGTLVANNTGATNLNGLTGATALQHVSTGTVTLNHTTPSSYTGDISVTGGGTLDVSGKAYGNRITMNKGSLANASAATNVYAEAAGNVNLGGVLGSNVKSLNTSVAGSSISGIDGSVTLASASLTLDVGNLSSTPNSDNQGVIGTEIITFNSTASTLTLDNLHLTIGENSSLRAYLTAAATRDEYAVMITNGTLAGAIAGDYANKVTYDIMLTQIGYRTVGVENGNVIISGQALNAPYYVAEDENKTLDSGSALDIYTYVAVDGILNIDLTPGDSLQVRELTGNMYAAMINTGQAGATVELNNDLNSAGTKYLGSISGSADIIKTGQYDLTIGSTASAQSGNVQTTGKLDVQEGNLNINGNVDVGNLIVGDSGNTVALTATQNVAVSGTTKVTDDGTLNIGGNLVTGALDLSSGAGLNMGGGTLALAGTGMTSTIADNASISGTPAITIDNDAIVKIGQNVNLNGATVHLGNLWDLDTKSDLTATGLNGDNKLALNGTTMTLNLGADASYNGKLIGNGTLVKTGNGTQTLMTTTNNSGYDLFVQEGTVILRKNQSSTQEVAYNSITVASTGTLAMGANTPNGSGRATTAYVNSANFHQDSTLYAVIPNDAGSISAAGTITLPHRMNLNLVNNDPNQFGDNIPTLVVMKADGGYLWGTDPASVARAIGDPIARGTHFDGWNVKLEKSIALFYGSADVYLDNDGKTILATPTGKNTTNALLGAAQSDNARAGANLLWDAGLQAAGSNLSNILDCIMDNIQSGNTARASRQMAATVGSTYMGIQSAQQADYKYQQTLIRNRITGMGLSQEYDYKNELPYYNAWVQGNGSYNKLDSDGDDAGHELNSWGGTVGFDMNVTPRLTLGAAFTVSHGDLKSNAADSLEGDLDMYYANLFGRYQYKRWTHVLILTGAWGEADTDRTVSFCNGSYMSHAKADANSYGAMYELTYDFALNRDRTTILQPLFNASITRTELDAFSETGAGNAGLNVGKMETTMGTISAGARMLALVGSNVFGREAVGELRAQVLQDIGPDHIAGDVSYQVNPGLSQRIRGAKIGRTGVQLGAGLTIPVGNQGSIFTEINADLRDRATSVNGSLGYRYNF